MWFQTGLGFSQKEKKEKKKAIWDCAAKCIPTTLSKTCAASWNEDDPQAFTRQRVQ